MNGNGHDRVKKLLSTEQQQIAESIATMRVENEMLRKALDTVKRDHLDLWKVMVVLLHALEGHEMRIHKSQFLRFDEEYRILRTFDEETSEVVMTLTLRADKKGDGG